MKFITLYYVFVPSIGLINGRGHDIVVAERKVIAMGLFWIESTLMGKKQKCIGSVDNFFLVKIMVLSYIRCFKNTMN